MSRPDDVLSALRDDIERVRTDSRWTYFDGHLPRGPNPDRVAGIEARDVIGRDEAEALPERVRFDIGVADHHCRTAFQDSAVLIMFVDLRLAAALQAFGIASPRFVRVLRYSSLEVRETALSWSLWRVEALSDVWDSGDRHQQKAARVQLADPRISPPSARSAADQAVRILSRALSRGSTQGMATAEKYCANCGLQPVGERTGERCPACAQYKWRSRGLERPAKLYAADNSEAFAAAARRRARGEGFGDS